MTDACLALDFPVVSGNVSLYNETNGTGILPTPAIGGVGLIEDVNNDTTSAGFTAEGEAILLIGNTSGHLGRSMLLRVFSDNYRDAGAPPPVDLEAERRNGDFVRDLIVGDRVSACHDVSDGGLLVAAAEMALLGSIGAEISLPTTGIPAFAWLFGEDQSRYITTTSAPEEVLAAANSAGVPAIMIGTTGGPQLTVGDSNSISLSELRHAHESWFPEYMADV
jgi:phosphoribosylformylglycinamidine synthase